MAYTTINKGSDYFNTVTYTGNGGTQSVTGVGFQPDWCWIKSRSNPGVYGHETYDVIRGVRNNLSPNSTDAEFTIPTTGFESFDSDGFTVQLSDNYARGLNENNQLIVSWNWLAGGTASSNTDGTITSQVSANTTSGFSVVSYTGTGATATVGHGLGVAPKFIIYKQRNTARNWYVFTDVIDGSYDNLYLNLTDAKTDRSITLPTSSVFSLSSSNEHNESSGTYIAYCFAEKKGFSKFGSYTGNGNADGTFVFTGMRPSFVLAKRTNSASGWVLFDTAREPFNLADTSIRADDSGAENESNGALDILSNGFKWRTTDTGVNGSGDTYIYMAFAENPFVSSTGTPVTAR